MTWALNSGSNHQPFRRSDVQTFSHPSRSLPLNNSIHAFCHSDPGLINTSSMLVVAYQFATAWATNSGP